MTLKVLKTVTFPSYLDTVKFVSYKIMPRAQNSHAHVNAGFLFKFNINDTLDAATIVFGNINPTFIHATASEALLVGKDLFDDAILQQVYAALAKELIADVIPPDPSPDFRKQLAIALFYKVL
jgi:xanthine dehydrogenase/oxidase